jgi:hypothetical protein
MQTYGAAKDSAKACFSFSFFALPLFVLSLFLAGLTGLGFTAAPTPASTVVDGPAVAGLAIPAVAFFAPAPQNPRCSGIGAWFSASMAAFLSSILRRVLMSLYAIKLFSC